jgi:hypothetical protein
MRLRSAYGWIVISALVLMALFGLVFSATSAVENSPSELNKANSLFSVLEEANATVVKVFHQLDAKGVATPEDSLAQYNQALLLADEAVTLMQVGDYSEASLRIVQALQRLRESLRIVYTTVAVQPTEFEVKVEKAVTINGSINRCFEQLLRIENATGTAKLNGYNTTLLEAKIQSARSLLQEATRNLDEGRFEAASDSVAEAKVLIDDLSNSLGELAVDLKVQRLSAYIMEAEVRLESLKARAISISSAASLTYVNQAETSLNSAKEYLQHQLLNETLFELANSRDSELQAEETLKSMLNSTSSVTGSNLTLAASP